jgi:UDP-2,3-diacylglucosamine hydrolase
MINLFISDLHLDEFHPQITDIFLNFLLTHAARADGLYILGDFFEFWVGDDDLSPYNLLIIEALRAQTAAGLPIYFMQGNRDFLVGKKFMRLSGCRLLPDEYIVDLGGTPTLLLHGDTLCTQDIAYQKFRKRSRNWFIQKLFLTRSLSARKKVAENYRRKSESYTRSAPENIMDVTTVEVERVMKKHQVQHLIHGHTHRPAQHDFILDGKPATRTVLPAWHALGTVLVCTDDHKEIVTL